MIASAIADLRAVKQVLRDDLRLYLQLSSIGAAGKIGRRWYKHQYKILLIPHHRLSAADRGPIRSLDHPKSAPEGPINLGLARLLPSTA